MWRAALRVALAVVLLVLVGVCVWFHMRWRTLRRLARRTAAALRRHGPSLVWWVDFGSLLGLVREGDVIRHDNDVDVSVLVRSPEDERAIRRVGAALRAEGFAFAYKLHPFISRVFGPWYAFVDIYHAPRDGDTVRGPTGPGSDAPAALILDNDNDAGAWRWWSGPRAWVRVPRDPEGLLVWRYGADWRVPRLGYKGRDSSG